METVLQKHQDAMMPDRDRFIDEDAVISTAHHHASKLRNRDLHEVHAESVANTLMLLVELLRRANGKTADTAKGD